MIDEVSITIVSGVGMWIVAVVGVIVRWCCSVGFVRAGLSQGWLVMAVCGRRESDV